MSCDILPTNEDPLVEPGIAVNFPFLPTHILECILAFCTLVTGRVWTLVVGLFRQEIRRQTNTQLALQWKY
jgi:hypothetical protein